MGWLIHTLRKGINYYVCGYASHACELVLCGAINFVAWTPVAGDYWSRSRPAKPAQLRNYFILRTLDLARGTADKLRRAHKRLRNGS